MLLCFEGRVFHLMCLDFKGSVLFTQGKYVLCDDSFKCNK